MSVINQKPSWVEVYNVDESTWNSLLSEANAQNCSPLAIAMEKNIINEQNYLKEQQNLFEIPVIEESFFNSVPKEDVFTGYDLKECKKEGYLPIAQWDNHTLFAKLIGEKTSFEQKNPNGIYLLSSWSSLKKWFQIWEKSKTVLDSPQGLDIKTTATGSALENISFSDIKLETKENSQTNITIIKSEPLAIPEIPVAAPIPVQPVLPPIPASVAPLPPLPQAAQNLTAYPNIPLPDLNPLADQTPITTITSLTNLSGGPVAAIPLDQLAGRARLVQNYDDLCTLFFGCWKNFFEKSVILNYENDKLKTYRWDGQWATPDFRKMLEIDLSKPSIFKIAVSSEHPYHGHIVTNEINKKFFDECNLGQIPEFINVMPLMQNKKVVGLILGACSISASKTFGHNQLESYATLFNDQLLRVKLPIPKAG